MTDLELVKLAAKAAGMEIRKPMKYRNELEAKQSGYDNDGFNWWSPLTDDGDALRLAVKLKMSVNYLEAHPKGYEPARVSINNGYGIVEVIHNDPYAATRRAIVRAAAEIGKGMK
jgi:hypothetical protein